MYMTEMLNDKAELHDEQIAKLVTIAAGLTKRIEDLESREAKHLEILRAMHSMNTKLAERVDFQASEVEMLGALLKPIEPTGTKGAN